MPGKFSDRNPIFPTAKRILNFVIEINQRDMVCELCAKTWKRFFSSLVLFSQSVLFFGREKYFLGGRCFKIFVGWVLVAIDLHVGHVFLLWWSSSVNLYKSLKIISQISFRFSRHFLDMIQMEVNLDNSALGLTTKVRNNMQNLSVKLTKKLCFINV